MTLVKMRTITFAGLFLILICAPNSSAQLGSIPTGTAAPNESANLTKAAPPSGSANKRSGESSDTRDLEGYKVPTTTLNPQQDPDEWQFQLTPYLWIAGISGRAGVGDLVVDVESGITDSDVHLNFGFMATFEARKGRWIILTDFQYSNLGTERPRPTAPIFNNATASFKTLIIDPEVGYRVLRNTEKGRSLDVLGGIRYWRLNAELTLDSSIVASQFAERSKQWVDVVGGLRGRAHLTKKFFVVGKADLGGGGSEFTYQLFGGGGYQFNETFSIIGAYRHLSVDYDKDNFLFDMALHGPLFGVGIRF